MASTAQDFTSFRVRETDAAGKWTTNAGFRTLFVLHAVRQMLKLERLRRDARDIVGLVARNVRWPEALSPLVTVEELVAADLVLATDLVQSRQTVRVAPNRVDDVVYALVASLIDARAEGRAALADAVLLVRPGEEAVAVWALMDHDMTLFIVCARGVRNMAVYEFYDTDALIRFLCLMLTSTTLPLRDRGQDDIRKYTFAELANQGPLPRAEPLHTALVPDVDEQLVLRLLGPVREHNCLRCEHRVDARVVKRCGWKHAYCTYCLAEHLLLKKDDKARNASTACPKCEYLPVINAPGEAQPTCTVGISDFDGFPIPDDLEIYLAQEEAREAEATLAIAERDNPRDTPNHLFECPACGIPRRRQYPTHIISCPCGIKFCIACLARIEHQYLGTYPCRWH